MNDCHDCVKKKQVQIGLETEIMERINCFQYLGNVVEEIDR